MSVKLIMPLLMATLILDSAFAAEKGLDSALQATLLHHPSISGKKAELAAKQFDIDVVKAQRYPSLSAQLGVQSGSANGQGNNSSYYRVRQPVWAFGRIDSNISYAEAEYWVNAADLLRVERELLEQTAVAYVKVISSQQQVAVANENVSDLNELVERIKHREKGQVASRADVMLAKSRLVQAQVEVSRAEGALDVAETELQALTQIPIDADAPIPDALIQLPSMAALEDLARMKNADVMVKRGRVALAEAALKRDKKAPMPTVFLQADKAYGTFNNDTRFGVTLEGNLEGLGFAAIGRSRSSGARLQAGKDDLASTQNDVVRMVKSFDRNRQLNQQLKVSLSDSIEGTQAILGSFERQYKAGRKNWLDLLNMQREYFSLRNQYVQVSNEWQLYSLKLMALTGGLDALAGIKQDSNEEQGL